MTVRMRYGVGGWGSLALAVTLVGTLGCGIPPNTAPISIGVPDGFVLERQLIPPDRPYARSERVIFACRGERRRATITTPFAKQRLPAFVGPYPPSESKPIAAVVIVTERGDPVTVQAAVAMAKGLEEVDPNRVRLTQ